MKRTPVIVYTRVSTEKQGAKGVSLEDQRIELERFIAENLLEGARFFSEMLSARKEKKGYVRPEFEAACRLAVKNDWPMLVTTASRFTRKLEEFDYWIGKGLRLIVANLGMHATELEIRTALIMVIDQYEQRQRTAAIGRQRALHQGKLCGHTVPAHGREKSVQTRQNNARKGAMRRSSSTKRLPARMALLRLASWRQPSIAWASRRQTARVGRTAMFGVYFTRFIG